MKINMNSKRSVWKWALALSLLIGSFSVERLLAHYEPTGGEVPPPFRKVELAPGETYVLTGTVLEMAGFPVLKVNLKNHPWLSNNKRVLNPYYELSLSRKQLKHYFGKEVQIRAMAVGVVKRTSSGHFAYDITLTVLAEPQNAAGYQPDRTGCDDCDCSKKGKRVQKNHDNDDNESCNRDRSRKPGR